MKYLYFFILLLFIVIKISAQAPISLINMLSCTCTNDKDGAATFSINGTSFPYSATLTGCNTVTLSGINTNTFTVTGLGNCLPYTQPWPDGSYNVQLDDNTNTPAGFLTFSMTPVYPFFLLQASSWSAITCPGANNGSTSWTTVYGTGPFSFLWSSPTTTNYSTSSSITNVSPGIYTITATDVYGCQLSWTSIFNEPYINTQTTTATSPGCCDGSLIYNVVGAGPPGNYTYSVVPPIVSNYSVCVGNYTVMASSSTCTMSTGVSIPCITGMDEEVFSNEISVFPNPVSSVLKFSGIKEFPNGSGIIITNCTGQTVHEGKLSRELNVESFESGYYFITLRISGDRFYHSKFIKE
jgi:hypothetical protein